MTLMEKKIPYNFKVYWKKKSENSLLLQWK